MLTYEEPVPLARAMAEAELASGDLGRTCRAVVAVAVALYDPDGGWVESLCLGFLDHENPGLRRLAATCLGHVARIHGRLNEERVVGALRARRGDPEIAGAIEDALGDIETFVGRN